MSQEHCDVKSIEIYPVDGSPEYIDLRITGGTELAITFCGISMFDNGAMGSGSECLNMDTARAIRDFLIYAVPENK